MIFYTILFSLGDPAKNEYIWCCMMWLKSIYISGTFQKGDNIVILCDSKTLAHLKTINLFNAAPGLQLVNMGAAPKDCRDGMKWKYVFHPNINDIVVYADTDQIFRRPFRPDLSPDSLLVYPEGDITHSNYCGEYQLGNGPGFTAGFWAYKPGPKMMEFLQDTLKACQESTREYFTLDQPHFNSIIRKLSAPIAILKMETISFNGNNHLQEATILNLAGNPGEGAFHFQKMIDMFLLLG